MAGTQRTPNLAQYARETILDDVQVESWVGASVDVLMSLGAPYAQVGRWRRWVVGQMLDWMEKRAKVAA